MVREIPGFALGEPVVKPEVLLSPDRFFGLLGATFSCLWLLCRGVRLTIVALLLVGFKLTLSVLGLDV